MTYDLWNLFATKKVNTEITSASVKAITAVLDGVMMDRKVELAFETSMLANSAFAASKARGGGLGTSPVGKTAAMLIHPIASAIMESGSLSAVAGKSLQLIQATLSEPNIGGIPISSATIETERDIEISEQMVIVQSVASKQYWTDNAVPRLKTWSLEGYLTSADPDIDRGYTIKPTLSFQQFYLDTVASSRRPVLFKTNRGDFVKVQITNLHFHEEASYNNAIQISCELKEYNPYIVSDAAGSIQVARQVGA